MLEDPGPVHHVRLCDVFALTVYVEMTVYLLTVLFASGAGKAFEDKRGKSISSRISEKSWLYLNGHSVVCSRHMELAAMISSINPCITHTSDSFLLSTLQQVHVSELFISYLMVWFISDNMTWQS